MTISDAVRERIIELCNERGITINKLGIMSGVTQSTIQCFTSGQHKGTTISTIKKLCDGLEISILEFFDNERFASLEQELR